MTGLSRRLKKAHARLYRKRQKMRYFERAQAGFELLDLMTEEIEKEKLLQFLRGTEMDDLRVVGILGPENFE